MKKIKQWLKILGPGFITGASDDDPSGIGTYAQTGAHFGYGQLWTALFSFPLMTVVQEMCGRIGMVTGKGIAAIVKEHYQKQILYVAVFLLVTANTINIGADLGAMASSAQLVLGMPFAVWLIGLTALTILLEICVPYQLYAKFLKYLTFSLLAYIITAFAIRLDWAVVVWSTFVPHFAASKEYLLNIVAILGTTISPYLFFWQANEEVEEEIAHHKLRVLGGGQPRVTPRDISRLRKDTIIGMLFSNIVMFFIIVTTAATLNANGITDIQTADQAAEALRPLAGDFAFLLFAGGIIGTGLLTVPILAGSASYAIAETVGWRAGLGLKFKRARGFYLVIAIATLIGLLINLTPIKPFQMLYYSAIINGIAAPPLLILIMIIANNKKIMGTHTNTTVSNVLGWLITGVMSVASVALLVSIFV